MTTNLTKTVVRTTAAPGAVGPYSQAVVAGNLVFTSGQIPLDPATGELVPGGIEQQTERVMENLKALLAAAGSGLEHAVKTTVFLTSMADFAGMNTVFARYFPEGLAPARSAVAVAALPKGASLEIEAVAVVPHAGI